LMPFALALAPKADAVAPVVLAPEPTAVAFPDGALITPPPAA